LSKSPTLKEVEGLGKRFAAIQLEDEATLDAQHRDLVGRVHSLRDRQSALENALGLAGETLDRAACHAELKEKERSMQMRDRGVEIVSVARRRIAKGAARDHGLYATNPAGTHSRPLSRRSA
jgi:hypothetical protein